MANTHCRLLSNGAHFMGNDLGYTPCCWIPPNTIPIQNLQDLRRARSKVTRQVMSDTKKMCKSCLDQEWVGGRFSFRQGANQIIPEDADPGHIYQLTLQIDTTCNAACVMCGPQFSSLWQKQQDPKYQIPDFGKLYKTLQGLDDWKYLRRLTLAGGEPFASDHNLNFIKQLPLPELITIHFNTNGSIWPNDEWLQVLSKFQKVVIIFSLDGMGPQFDYIRWPLSWSKVETNIRRWIDQQKTNANVFLGANLTVNPMNLIYIPELVNYLSLDLGFIKSTVTQSVCYGTWGLDGTPDALRHYMQDLYGDEDLLVKMLHTQPETNGRFQLLQEDMIRLDHIRNLDHRKTFDKVFKLLDTSELTSKELI